MSGLPAKKTACSDDDDEVQIVEEKTPYEIKKALFEEKLESCKVLREKVRVERAGNRQYRAKIKTLMAR